MAWKGVARTLAVSRWVAIGSQLRSAASVKDLQGPLEGRDQPDVPHALARA